MTLADAISILGPYILAAFALAGTVYSIVSQKGKTKADTADKIAAATSDTIDALTEEITRLNLKAASMLLQNADSKVAVKRGLELIARLLQGINILLAQVRVAGLSPDWLPDAEIGRLIQLCSEETERIDIPKAIPMVQQTPPQA
jgi:hypothetical protein